MSPHDTDADIDLRPQLAASIGIVKQRDQLARLLERYMNMYPAFRMKPEGAPGSQARDEQQRKMDLEDAARIALGGKL